MGLSARDVGRCYPAKRYSYDRRDTIVYALGVGAGVDDPIGDLPFLYGPSLRALPSQATVVSWDEAWISDLGLDEQLLVHGEQRVTLHRPLPAEGTVYSTVRIADMVDKGRDRGAIIYVETTIVGSDEVTPIATLLSTVFARGDGGFGGRTDGGIAPHVLPTSAPDLTFETRIPRNQAHIYRLSGDKNPLHVDPDFARRAGFLGPILHGLSTYGVAVRGVLQAALDRDVDRVEHVAARFAAPLYPGEAVRLELWQEGLEISFRLIETQTERVVLNNGLVRLRA